MPIEIKDLHTGIRNLIVGRGFVTTQEYVDSISKHLNQDQDKLKKYRYSISDYTAVTDFEVPTENIEYVMNLAKEAAIVNPEVIVAIVADQDVLYGLSRMSEILINDTNWETMVFRNREDANEWIKERVKEKYGIDDLTFG